MKRNDNESRVRRRRVLKTVGALSVAASVAGCNETTDEDAPTVTGAVLPPTALEPEDTLACSVDFRPAGENSTSAAVGGTVDVYHRGTHLDSVSLDADYAAIAVPEENDESLSADGLRATYELPGGNTVGEMLDSLDVPPQGARLLVELALADDGYILPEFRNLEPLLGDAAFTKGSEDLAAAYSTHVFETVESVVTIPALANDQSSPPSGTGATLYAHLRRKAEAVNAYYASGLGSMGAHGFDFSFPTFFGEVVPPFWGGIVEDGWVVLDATESDYSSTSSDIGNRPVQFVEDGLDIISDSSEGVNYSDYDTAAVLSGSSLGRQFYLGDIPSDGTLGFDLGPLSVEVSLDPILGEIPFAAHETSTGRIDVWHDVVDGDAWRHELGHTMGPDTQVGLMDLYDEMMNFGSIGQWGLMGKGETLSSFSRGLGGRFFDPDPWLQPVFNLHLITDTAVSLAPLAQATIGDTVEYVTSIWAEFDIEVHYAVSVNVDTPWGSVEAGVPTGVTGTPLAFFVQTYVLEARESGPTHVSDPEAGTQLQRSPSSYDGVTLYRLGLLHIETSGTLEGTISGDNPLELEDFKPLNLEYLPQNVGAPDDPTLSLDHPNPAYATYHDTNSLTTFELTDPVAPAPASVRLERDAKGLLGDVAGPVLEVVADLGDFLEDVLSDIVGLEQSDEPLPGVDIVLETPGGDRLGTNPETGEIYEDLRGGRVSGGLRTRSIVVPLGGETAPEDVTVRVSAARLVRGLEARGITPPDPIPYTRSVVVTVDPTIRETGPVEIRGREMSVPHIEGRTRQTVRTWIDERTRACLVTPSLTFDPGRIGDRVSRQFVHADISFDREISPEVVELETATLGSVRAVHEGEHEFVQTPIIESGGRTTVRLTFRTRDVVEEFSRGSHDVAVTGVFGDLSFASVGELTIV